MATSRLKSGPAVANGAAPAVRRASVRPPSALASVARQKVVVVGGLLEEVSRSYVARLKRELEEVESRLAIVEGRSSLPKRCEKELGKLLEHLGRLDVDPEKGRRKDLKKIDALIGKIQRLAENW